MRILSLTFLFQGALITSMLIPNNTIGQTQLTSPDYAESEKFYYDFHPMSSLRLGGSFDPNHLDEGKISPLASFEVDTADGQGAIQTNFDVQLVYNAQQLRKAMRFDAKMNARYFRVKANASFSSSSDYRFNSTDINMVITARSEFSRLAIKEPQLTDAAKKLVGSPKRFAEVFGSRVVTMERRGNTLYVLLKISDVSTSMRKRIAAEFGASAKFGPVKISMSSSLNQLFQNATQNKQVQLTLVSSGDEKGIAGTGGTLKALQNIQIMSGGQLFKDLVDKLAEYMQSMEPRYAKPIGYFTTSVNNLGLPRVRVQDVLYSQRLEKAMTDVAERYRDAESELDMIRDLLEGQHAAYIYLSAADRSVLRAAIQVLRSKMEELSLKQDELIARYDDTYKDGRVERIEENESGRFGRWRRLFMLPTVPMPASAFLERISSEVATVDPSEDLIVRTRGIEWIQFSLDHVLATGGEETVRLAKPSLYVDPAATGKSDEAVSTSAAPRTTEIYNILARLDSVKFKQDVLKKYFESDTVQDIVKKMGEPKTDRYMANLLVRNSFGETTIVNIGTLYATGDTGKGVWFGAYVPGGYEEAPKRVTIDNTSECEYLVEVTWRKMSGGTGSTDRLTLGAGVSKFELFIPSDAEVTSITLRTTRATKSWPSRKWKMKELAASKWAEATNTWTETEGDCRTCSGSKKFKISSAGRNKIAIGCKP